MTENYGYILDALAFHSMSTKQLVELIADYVIERRSMALYYRYNQSDKALIEHRIDELVRKYGSIGGKLTRVKLTSKVLKRVRSRRWRSYLSRNGNQNT